jgi:hypothetical protein
MVYSNVVMSENESVLAMYNKPRGCLLDTSHSVGCQDLRREKLSARVLPNVGYHITDLTIPCEAFFFDRLTFVLITLDEHTKFAPFAFVLFSSPVLCSCVAKRHTHPFEAIFDSSLLPADLHFPFQKSHFSPARLHFNAFVFVGPILISLHGVEGWFYICCFFFFFFVCVCFPFVLFFLSCVLFCYIASDVIVLVG